MKIACKTIGYTIISALLWCVLCTPMAINKIAIAQVNSGVISMLMPMFSFAYRNGWWIFLVCVALFVIDIVINAR